MRILEDLFPHSTLYDDREADNPASNHISGRIGEDAGNAIRDGRAL